MLGHLGAMLGPCWAILGPCWAQVGPSWAILGLCWAVLGHLGAMLGLCWAILGPSWAYVGPMLAQACPYLSLMLTHVANICAKDVECHRAKKHCKLQGFLSTRSPTAGRRLGRQASVTFGYHRRPPARTRARGRRPDLSAYARQPARGPTMLAHLVAICWPMLAYVGLSCGQRGPILWLWWPMFPACWPMLSQKIRKIGTAKKRCKMQDILMVGGLSWGYVGPAWGYVGLS